ncbi:MAG: L-threonylcarbamoyladenylate synthase, partial [Candidatus Omnitrophica bacterium]|nr:L-threonylcarbamoyladenylate synthase [Candidatus Omnitrophota bacterium]
MNKTRILKVNPLNPQEEYLKEAGETIRRGGLVVIPTETVYEIALNSLNKEAIERLHKIKQCSVGKVFSLHIADKKKIEEYATEIPLYAYKLIYRLIPGPLTLVLKAKDKKEDTIGIRMPDNEVALKVISYSNVPVFCCSANTSGTPPPKSSSDVIKDLDGLVDLILDSGETRLGKESTVVDCTDKEPKILQQGVLDEALIKETAKKKSVLFICTGNSCRSVMA